MVGKVIYNLLSNSAELTSLIGSKIYPSVSLNETAVNYIVYQKNGATPTNCKDGRSTLDILNYDILIFAESLDILNSVALGVRNTLDHYSGVNSGLTIDKIIYEGEDDDFDEKSKIYFKAVSYEIRFKNIYSSLARPTNFYINDFGPTQLFLFWDDNATGETGYKVYRSNDLQNFTLRSTEGAGATNSTDTVTQGQIYYYYVVAYDSNGNGYASEIVAQRTN